MKLAPITTANTSANLRPGSSARALPPVGVEDFLAAAIAGDVSVVERYLAEGGSPEARDAGGRTATMLAAVCGHREVLRALLLGGAKACVADDRGRTTDDYMRSFGMLSEANRQRWRAMLLRSLMRHVARSRKH